MRDLDIEHESSPLRIRLAIRLGSDAALERALVVLADRTVPQADRLALVEIAGQVGDPRAVEPLLKLVDEQETVAVQSDALAALAKFSDPRIAALALATLPTLKPEARCAPQTLLCGREPWAVQLLEAVDRGELKPAEISSSQLRQIALFKDARIAELMAKHWGTVADETPAEKRARIHGISVSMNLASGDAAAGKPLFAKHCGVCHTLFGEGNKVGPDLTGAERKNRDFLLTSIVDPSAVVRKEFFNYVVETKDGRVLTGLIVEDTPATMTLLDAKNQRTQLSRDDVDRVERAQQSLMPEKILDELDADQVRDLMRYLQSEGPVAGN